jgi:hypothetical protein
MDDTVPLLHKFAAGLLVRLEPLDEPQAPLTEAGVTNAEH